MTNTGGGYQSGRQLRAVLLCLLALTLGVCTPATFAGAALPLLQRAHDLDPNGAAIAYHLALALDGTGKRPEAKTLLQSTLAKNPKFLGAENAREVLARW